MHIRALSSHPQPYSIRLRKRWTAKFLAKEPNGDAASDLSRSRPFRVWFSGRSRRQDCAATGACGCHTSPSSGICSKNHERFGSLYVIFPPRNERERTRTNRHEHETDHHPLHRRRPLQVHDVLCRHRQLPESPRPVPFHRPRQDRLPCRMRRTALRADRPARRAGHPRREDRLHEAQLPHILHRFYSYLKGYRLNRRRVTCNRRPAIGSEIRKGPACNEERPPDGIRVAADRREQGMRRSGAHTGILFDSQQPSPDSDRPDGVYRYGKRLKTKSLHGVRGDNRLKTFGM